AVEQDATAGRRQHAADDIDQRGLACAVRTDHAEHLPRRNRKVQVVEDLQAAEALADRDHFQQRTSARGHGCDSVAAGARSAAFNDGLDETPKRSEIRATVPTMPSRAARTTTMIRKPNRSWEYSPRSANTSPAHTSNVPPTTGPSMLPLPPMIA